MNIQNISNSAYAHLTTLKETVLKQLPDSTTLSNLMSTASNNLPTWDSAKNLVGRVSVDNAKTFVLAHQKETALVLGGIALIALTYASTRPAKEAPKV